MMHTATLLQNGNVLLAGSTTGVDSYAGAELYDPTGSGNFAATGSMASPRAYHTATLLLDGRVLIVGGVESYTSAALQSSELFDSSGAAPTPGAVMTEGRQGHTATLLKNGQVLIVGGNSGTTYRSSAELYAN